MIETIEVRADDGAATGARMCGSSDAALIFVHGVGSTAAIWDEQLAHFSDRYRCVAIELRGNGVPKPEPDPSQITRAGYARDVLAVTGALGIGRFTIVGCSLGGVVAFELWKTAPKLIEAMVIVGSFAVYPNARTYADGIKAAVRDAGTMESFARARAAKMGLPPARTRETIEQMACKNVDSYLAATEATWTGDYVDVLPTIDVPVFVTCGERDTIAPLALSQQIASSIPGARLAVLEDAGHVANADNPAAFDRVLDSFVSEAVPVR
ncbi:MAG: alpha/beta fold hydrolase, partial [Candidatus Eremiobacteraeota bacterium]|nr:alpha/beta fold hydrolase [Candidatus Eremiobacteraeota bacterium]